METTDAPEIERKKGYNGNLDKTNDKFEKTDASLGRYFIGRELGEGASCRVKLAIDTKDNKQVAVKIMKKLNEKYMKEMLTELSNLLVIDHPNVL